LVSLNFKPNFNHLWLLSSGSSARTQFYQFPWRSVVTYFESTTLCMYTPYEV